MLKISKLQIKSTFLLTISLFLLTTTSVLAWPWGGEGECSFSKDQANQEKSEEIEKSDEN